MHRTLTSFAAFNAFLAVALGAVGSHMIQDPQARAWMETASRFQLPHAVAVFALLAWRPAPLVHIGAALLLAGAFIFSSALYLLAFGIRLPVLAPIGGFLMMAGWLWIAVQAIIKKSARRY